MINNSSNSKIKIAIFSGYGSCDIPEWLLKNLPTPIYGVESRIKLAELLCNLKPTCTEEEATQKAWDKFSKSKSMKRNPYFKIEGDNKVHLKICKDVAGSIPLEVEVSIEEIDISKPWRITEYDGGEYVEVFNGISVKDEKYNMCEW